MVDRARRTMRSSVPWSSSTWLSLLGIQVNSLTYPLEGQVEPASADQPNATHTHLTSDFRRNGHARADQGRSHRASAALETPGIHRGRGPHAGAWHRGEHGDLQRHLHDVLRAA